MRKESKLQDKSFDQIPNKIKFKFKLKVKKSNMEAPNLFNLKFNKFNLKFEILPSKFKDDKNVILT